MTWTDPDSLPVRSANSSRVVAVEPAPLDTQEHVRTQFALQTQPQAPGAIGEVVEERHLGRETAPEQARMLCAEEAVVPA